MKNKEIINGTINIRGGDNSFPIVNRIFQEFIFSYDPSKKGVHLVPLTIGDVNTQEASNFFIKTLDLSYVKDEDKLVFLLQFEGWMTFLEHLNNSFKQFYPLLNFQNVYFASEQLNFDEIPIKNKPKINHLALISQDTWFPQNAIKIPHTYDLKDKIFLCYNNTPSPHRVQLVSFMNSEGLLDNSLTSFSCKNSTDIINDDIFLHPKNKKFFIENLVTQDLIIDVYDSKNWFSSEQYKKTALHHFRTMISVVTETHWYTPELSFTEKIYRSLSFGHPFIVVGQVNFLKYLREYGFQTFDSVFSEKYDSIVNPHLRLQEIVKLMKHIQSLSEKEKNNMWEKLNQIAKYNLNVFNEKEFTKKTGLYKFLINFSNVKN